MEKSIKETYWKLSKPHQVLCCLYKNPDTCMKKLNVILFKEDNDISHKHLSDIINYFIKLGVITAKKEGRQYTLRINNKYKNEIEHLINYTKIYDRIIDDKNIYQKE